MNGFRQIDMLAMREVSSTHKVYPLCQERKYSPLKSAGE